MRLPSYLLLLSTVALDVSSAFTVTAPFGVMHQKLSRSSQYSSWFQWGSQPTKKETDGSAPNVVSSPTTEEASSSTSPEATSSSTEQEEAAAPAVVVVASAEVSATAAEPAVVATEEAPVEEAADEVSGEPRRQYKKKPFVKKTRHTVFVGNLSFDMTDDELRELFAAHATVEFVSIPRNRVTGRARGFAFVDVGSAEEVQAVIQNMDGMMVGGRNLRVTESLPKDEVVKDRQQQQQQPQSPPQRKVAPTPEGGKKIYVGNLPFDTNQEELEEFFGQYGEIKDIYVPMDTNSGTSRGFAFITMEEDKADAAIDATNGAEYRGRKLAVSLPLPPGEKAQRGQGRQPRVKLYVGNLSFNTGAEGLREVFEQYGKVYDCYMPDNPSTGASRGFGFITMSPDAAERAIAETDGIELDGRVIRVNEAQAKGNFNNNNNNYDD